MPFLRVKNRQEIAEKIKKSEYLKDYQLLKLILLADNTDFLDDDKTPIRTDYVKKKGKLIGLPYTVSMDLFNYFMSMLGT